MGSPLLLIQTRSTWLCYKARLTLSALNTALKKPSRKRACVQLLLSPGVFVLQAVEHPFLALSPSSSLPRGADSSSVISPPCPEFAIPFPRVPGSTSSPLFLSLAWRFFLLPLHLLLFGSFVIFMLSAFYVLPDGSVYRRNQIQVLIFIK